MKSKKYQYIFNPPPYKNQKTWHKAYPFDLEEMVQEGLFDQALVIIWKGRGEKSEKVYEGDIDSYRYRKEKQRLEKKQDILRDFLSKHKATVIHRSKKPWP